MTGTREAVRQPLGQLRLQRMVRRVAQIAMTRDRIELWIEHKEVFREQSAVSHETAALIRNTRVAVQVIRKLTDAAIGDKCPSIVVRTQRRGTRDCRAIDYT